MRVDRLGARSYACFGKRERRCRGICDTGLPATKLVPVQARRTTVWPWIVLPFSVIWFAIVKWVADSDHPWGQLPFAEGHVEGVTATYEKSIGVIINGVHPEFVEATRRSQRDGTVETADVPDPVTPGDRLLGPNRTS